MEDILSLASFIDNTFSVSLIRDTIGHHNNRYLSKYRKYIAGIVTKDTSFCTAPDTIQIVHITYLLFVKSTHFQKKNTRGIELAIETLWLLNN